MNLEFLKSKSTPLAFGIDIEYRENTELRQTDFDYPLVSSIVRKRSTNADGFVQDRGDMLLRACKTPNWLRSHFQLPFQV